MAKDKRSGSRVPFAIAIAFSCVLGFTLGQVYHRIGDISGTSVSLPTFWVASDPIRDVATLGVSRPGLATTLGSHPVGPPVGSNVVGLPVASHAFGPPAASHAVGPPVASHLSKSALATTLLVAPVATLAVAPAIEPNRKKGYALSPAGDKPAIIPTVDKIPSISVGGIVSVEGIVKSAETIRGRYFEVIRSMPKVQECDMNDNDGLALLALAELAGVNILLESGTANGRSTEVMARYFTGRDMKVVTVDIGYMGHYACSANLTETHKRLKAFPNVEPRIGNSLEIFPKLIDKYKDKRVGLFIDGPKGLNALELCRNSLKKREAVKFCAFHDVGPEHYGDTAKKVASILNKWGRFVLMTCCSDKWLAPAGEYPSLAVVGGLDTFPYGVKGDRSRFPW